MYLKLIKDQFSISGRPRPYNCTITKCVGNDTIPEMIRTIVECFTLPIKIRIDFWAIVTSSSRSVKPFFLNFRLTHFIDS